MANIIVSGKLEGEIIKVCQSITDIFSVHCNDSLELLGPGPALLQKIKGQYRWQIILKSESFTFLRDILEDLDNKIKNNAFASTIKISIDINPLNIL